MKIHPGGETWFGPSQGRDISALVHTYHRDPVRLRKFLARYEIEGFTERDILPKLGVPPFLLDPDFDATTDLPRLDYRDEGSLLAEIRRKVNAKFSKRDLTAVRPRVRRRDLEHRRRCTSPRWRCWSPSSSPRGRSSSSWW